MNFEYEYCCLESQMPDPINADTSFNFGSHKRSCEFYLQQALEAIKQAQTHQDWDKYSVKTYYSCDLNLEDAVVALQASIAED